ncbi:dihydroxyacetone kinase subunit DhaK [Snodgrassella sp. W8132]|uniref:dihydroxyacetone kinase subunit DhaK n=1 Tax=Snodgrassella sp. W8132 TaxID=2750994 RepID=UPI0018DB7020|nr:dihydroxyacetone kinase subunit DhaK [Snodgrassella sp. W8132]MBI0132267.1 dihydroxyacetone kinase subunit DhaK [Snodgrassella sp. W8132]
MSRFFFNDRKQLVNEAIEGLIISAPEGNLVRLDTDPAIRVVMRNDWEKSKVAVISGGGSGHEPAHAGFVGKGMLTAAVCGDLFASPSVDAVFSAIMAVTGEQGCLLIVKNYTGDRLNFGLAAEKAKSHGINVEMVIVADDISLPENRQPRGIAGTVLVHKIAGYAAEEGKSLSQVREIAQQTCDNLYSLGVAMQTCNLPDYTEERRIKAGQVELGLGIHGEPGASVEDTHNSKILIDTLVQALSKSAGAGRFAVLINNLGGVSALEMAVLTRELAHSAISKQTDLLIGPASLVTSLDMKGFSLSLLKLNDYFSKALNAPVETQGWQKPVVLQPLKTVVCETEYKQSVYIPSENARIAEYITVITDTLIRLENQLNALDAKVGDGDTGSTFAHAAHAIASQLAQKHLPLNDLPQLLLCIGERLSVVMGGSSGVLMSIFFTAAGQKLQTGGTLVDALLNGLAQMKHYGGADIGDRTLIDALQPALDAWQNWNFSAAIQAAREGAEKTAGIHKAGAGRSSYVNQQNLAGVPDPGAVAVAEVFTALGKLQIKL